MQPIKTVGILTLHLPETIEAAGGGKAFKNLVKQVRQTWRNHKKDSVQLSNHLRQLGVSLPEGQSFGWFRMRWTRLQRFFNRNDLKATAEHQKLNSKLFESKSLDELKAALDAGADVNYRHPGYSTLLNEYAASGTRAINAFASRASLNNNLSLDERAKIIELLLERGGKISIADATGNTPLHVVCEYASTKKLAALMLEKGKAEDIKAALLCQNSHGDTPLHNLASAINPNSELMKEMLMIAPEARKLKNSTGKTPYDLLPGNQKAQFGFLTP